MQTNYKYSVVLKIIAANKAYKSGKIPISNEVSRVLSHNFDADITSLKEKSKIRPVIDIYPYSGIPGEVVIETVPH